ncbi:MAG: YpdA family putative bacillithiol disulfide reductase, partial [Mucilaginibacter polytrichastri]|nr:YpdA family putative bacillithiol disulfide reductase [Mucilaginibacter polytrichastri]
VIIVGGGPIGLACAIHARAAGLFYVILEKGCLVNSLYNYPVNMTFFSTSERLEIGSVPFMSILPKPNRAEALEYYRRVATSYELNTRLFEEVTSAEYVNGGWKIYTTKSAYRAQYVILATGFYDIPNLLNIPGEGLPKVKHYYRDPHFYAFQKVLVIGANNSAVDVALETYRKGAEVTMVIREPEIGERVKYWVRPDIVNRIKEGSIKAYFNARVSEITGHEVHIETDEGVEVIKNDFVLAMTGYQPNFKLLENFGVVLSDDIVRKPFYDPETMETNQPGLYLAGVVCGGMDTHSWFIENSREHAEKILSHITSREKSAANSQS